MDIKGYEGLYKANEDFTEITREGYWITQTNSHGEYKRFMKPKKIKIYIDNEGYLSATLKGEHKRIHCLKYRTLVGDIPKGFVIDHKDRNKLNNSIDNLRVVKQSVNARNVEIAKRPDIRKVGNKYSLRFSMNGIRKYYGLFETYEMAKDKYNELYAEREKHYKDIGFFI